MTTMKVSIREARQRFSELVNLVNTRGERIVLTSRNKPKAVLVSISDAESIEDTTISKKRKLLQLERINILRTRLAEQGVVSRSTVTLDNIRRDRLGDI
jgi:prevent-host-death family protein